MVPVKSLKSRSRDNKLAKDPNEEGIVPRMLIFSKLRVVKLLKLDNSSGI